MSNQLFPKFWKLKTAIGRSAIGDINPRALTPTMKLTMARARIWDENIGGNLRTGNKNFKKIADGNQRLYDIKWNDRDRHLPWDEPPDMRLRELNEMREARKARKGIPEITTPRKKYWQVRQFERVKWLRNDYLRRKRLGENVTWKYGEGEE